MANQNGLNTPNPIGQSGSQLYAADAGSTDAYAITLSPVPLAYATGMVVNFKANTINTGAATLNVNGLGAITIKKLHDQTLADGDIEAGQIVTVIYDSVGPVFQMQSQTATSASSGTVTSVSGTSNQINVATGTTTPVLTLSATVVAPGTIAATTITANRAMATDASKVFVSSATTDTELGYLNGVTSAVQTQLNTKITASSTDTLTNKSYAADGTGNSLTNVANANIKAAAAIAVNKLAALTVSRAVVSDGSGFVAAATTTATEIGYVNGVTSAIQTQLDAKTTSVTGTANQINSSGGATPTLSLSATLVAPGTVTLNADPVSALQAATKQYVDAISTGIDFKQACYAATTTALTVTYSNGIAGVGATLTNAGAQAAFAVDGQTVASGGRVLIKNQASTFQNGIYSVTTVGSGATNWVLTRTSDYNTVSSIFPGTLVPVDNGAVNAATSWLETATVVTIGTDPITFTQFTYGAFSVLQNGSPIFGADSVGTDAYAVTLTPAPSAYTTGMVVNFSAGTVNTGNATLNVNSLGAKNILKNHDQTLADGDIEAGQLVTVVYDGTQFQMQSQVGSTTGTGANVNATSPTLVTPALGTPGSGNLASCTGYPVASVANLGTGVATFLTTPSSANLLSALTTSTGTGSNVFATSPTLVTPVLGTPSSGNLSNCTSYPLQGMQLISTYTASSVAIIPFDNMLSATYDMYLIVFENVILSAARKVEAQFGITATPTYQATGYLNQSLSGSSTTTTTDASGTTFLGIGNANTLAYTANGTNSGSGFFYITNANQATNSQTVFGQHYFFSTPYVLSMFGGSWQGSSVITSIQLLLSAAGNFTTGTFKLYGLKN